MHNAIPLGHTAAAAPVEADGMDLVEVGQSVKSSSQTAYVRDWGDVPIHRVDRFKGDDLGARVACILKQRFEMIEVVVCRKIRFSAPLARIPAIMDA